MKSTMTTRQRLDYQIRDTRYLELFQQLVKGLINTDRYEVLTSQLAEASC